MGPSQARKDQRNGDNSGPRGRVGPLPQYQEKVRFGYRPLFAKPGRQRLWGLCRHEDVSVASRSGAHAGSKSWPGAPIASEHHNRVAIALPARAYLRTSRPARVSRELLAPVAPFRRLRDKFFYLADRRRLG